MDDRQVGGVWHEVLVLGIDASSKATGWAVVRGHEDGMPEVLACGTVKTKATQSLASRLVTIYDGISAVFADCNVQEAAYENPFFRRNPKTFGILSCVKGVVMLAAAQADVPIALYEPATVKSCVAGRFTGRADKDLVSEAVSAQTGCTVMADYDQSDAIAVALTHLLLRNAVDNDGPKQPRKSR